jgi:hypothetical protein
MGKPASFKIEYQCKGVFVPFADYLCFDHGGFATAAAQRKWLARGGTPYSPKTVADAFLRQNEILPAQEISVIKRGKYFEILSVKFTTAEKQQEQWEAQNPF